MFPFQPNSTNVAAIPGGWEGGRGLGVGNRRGTGGVAGERSGETSGPSPRDRT